MVKFSDLSTELVVMIARLVDPVTLFNLALSQRLTYVRVEHLFGKQRALSKKYRVIHDRHPLNMITTVREMILDLDVAWHVRRIEVWNPKQDFRSWSDIFRFDNISQLRQSRPELLHLSREKSRIDEFYAVENELWMQVRALWRDHSNLDKSFFTRREADLYFRMILGLLPMADAKTHAEEVLESFRKMMNTSLSNGNDEILTLMLVLCSPRLEELWYANWGTAGMSRVSAIAFGLQQATLKDPELKNRMQLPPGLRHLKRVNAGECHPYKSYNNDRHTIKASELMQFFALPSIEFLRLTGSDIYGEDYIWEWEPSAIRETKMSFGWPPGSMEGSSEPYAFEEGGIMWSLSKNPDPDMLYSLREYQCCTGTYFDVEILLAFAGKALEVLAFHEATPSTLGTLLSRFQNLKTLVVGQHYFTQDVLQNDSVLEPSLIGIDRSVSASIEDQLPSSLHNLVIHSDDIDVTKHNNFIEADERKERLELATLLLDRLCRLLEVTTKMENLSNICLQQTWHSTEHTAPAQLAKLIELCEARNITLHIDDGQRNPRPGQENTSENTEQWEPCPLCDSIYWKYSDNYYYPGFVANVPYHQYNWAHNAREARIPRPVNRSRYTPLVDDGDIPIDTAQWQQMIGGNAGDQSAEKLFDALLAKDKEERLAHARDLGRRIEVHC